MRRLIRWIRPARTLAAGIALWVGWSTSWALDTTPYLATVTHITDGDTLWVRHPDTGRRVKVRIQGIDAPELCQAYGQASKKMLTQRVMSRHVWVYPARWDDYGRVLADVKLLTDGKGSPTAQAAPAATTSAQPNTPQDVGAWMVSQGAAWSYRFRFDNGPYTAEQLTAKSEQRGLFADAAAMEPKRFRQTHGPCNNSRPSQPGRVPF